MNGKQALAQQRLAQTLAANARPDAVLDQKAAGQQQALMRALAAAQPRMRSAFKPGKGAIK